MDDHRITITPLYALQEMYEAVELQQIYWGSEIESVVPAHMLFSIATTGGHVIVARDGQRMVGVLIGLLGTDIEVKDRPAMANLLIASKRMVVLPEYRSSGIGYHLKLKQRELAIAQGIRLVTWTFDPLLARNAYLNMHKLGCISQKYLENYYGTDDSKGLASLGSSDRLSVEWWITNRRVQVKLDGTRADLSFAHYQSGNAVIVNPTQEYDGLVYPPETLLEANSTFVLLEIPLNYPEIVTAHVQLAMEWREHIRGLMQYLLARGYLITDFVREFYEGRDRVFYVLSYNSGFDFHLN